MNLDSALTQLFIGIATELVSKLRQNELARMHEYDTEHFLFQVRIERKRVAQEIVDARDGFDSGKPSTRNDKGQQRRAFRPRAFRIGFFEMRDQPIAQLNCVAELFHRQRVLGHAGKVEEIRHRPSARIRWSYSSSCECRSNPCETVTRLLPTSILSTSPQKKFTWRIILRTGLTMFVKSRSLAAISCNMGVNRKKFSRLLLTATTPPAGRMGSRRTASADSQVARSPECAAAAITRCHSALESIGFIARSGIEAEQQDDQRECEHGYHISQPPVSKPG